MKKILIVCLLGLGLLLPATTITAKNSITAKAIEKTGKRIIDTWVETGSLFVTSDPSSGTLSNVKVYNSLKLKVIDQPLSGYSDVVDVSGLKSGTYTVVVKSALSGDIEVISIQ